MIDLSFVTRIYTLLPPCLPLLWLLFAWGVRVSSLIHFRFSYVSYQGGGGGVHWHGGDGHLGTELVLVLPGWVWSVAYVRGSSQDMTLHFLTPYNVFPGYCPCLNDTWVSYCLQMTGKDLSVSGKWLEAFPANHIAFFISIKPLFLHVSSILLKAKLLVNRQYVHDICIITLSQIGKHLMI